MAKTISLQERIGASCLAGMFAGTVPLDATLLGIDILARQASPGTTPGLVLLRAVPKRDEPLDILACEYFDLLGCYRRDGKRKRVATLLYPNYWRGDEALARHFENIGLPRGLMPHFKQHATLGDVGYLYDALERWGDGDIALRPICTTPGAAPEDKLRYDRGLLLATQDFLQDVNALP